MPSPHANATSFKPGVSGNPSGRPKRTPEQIDTLEEIKALAPSLPARMSKMLDDPMTPVPMKVRIMEIILERTFGKPESAVKLTAGVSVEESARRIRALLDEPEEPEERPEEGLHVV